MVGRDTNGVDRVVQRAARRRLLERGLSLGGHSASSAMLGLGESLLPYPSHPYLGYTLFRQVSTNCCTKKLLHLKLLFF